MSKYNARGTRLEGIWFDSAAEARRYIELKALEAAGAIAGLQVHVLYVVEVAKILLENGMRKTLPAIRHEVNFRYILDGKVIVEDAKGVKTAVWKLKYGLFMRRFPTVEYRVINASEV